MESLIIPKRCHLECFRALVVDSYLTNTILPRDNWCENDNMCCLGSATASQSTIEFVWIIWSRTIYYLLVHWHLWIPFIKYYYNIVGTHLTASWNIYSIKEMADVHTKGGPRGQSRLSGCHMDYWAAHMSIARTVSQTKYIIIHSCILSRTNSTKNSIILIMMIKVQNVHE